MTMRFAATALAVFLLAGPVLAEECPDIVPEDSVQRRQQAKKWFSKGEDSTKEGDDLSALKAYQFSLKFVPHGFTAYNIAQVAERVVLPVVVAPPPPPPVLMDPSEEPEPEPEAASAEASVEDPPPIRWD